MKGVILAAGAGTRLEPLTRELPKPLVPVLGRPLIDYTIEAFARAGFSQLAVVTGHNGNALRRYLDDGSRYGLRIRCLPNSRYSLGNATSIFASQPFVQNEPFVVAMADHMISAVILKRLLACSGSSHTLCVDRLAYAPPQINDATKVWVDELGFVTRIGKNVAQWNAVDTGVFLFAPRIFSHIAAGPQNDVCSITRTVRRMISRGDPMRTCDVSGAFWLDVDTPEDLKYARTALHRWRSVAAERRSVDASRDPGSSARCRQSAGLTPGVRGTPGTPTTAGSTDSRMAAGASDRAPPRSTGY